VRRATLFRFVSRCGLLVTDCDTNTSFMVSEFLQPVCVDWVKLRKPVRPLLEA